MSGLAVDTTIRSTLGDALLLIDEATLTTVDDAILHALNVVMDPEGVTDMAQEFPGESWQTVWQREGMPIWSLCEEGRLLVVLLECGEYHVRAFGDTLASAGLEIKAPPSMGRLVAHGSSIGLISGLEWMRRRTLGPRAPSYRSIPVSPGDKCIEIGYSAPPAGDSFATGKFWLPGWPAILLGVNSEGRPNSASNVFRLTNNDLLV